MSEKDFEGLDYLLWSHSVSKERSNYLIISVLSVVSISVVSIIASPTLDLGVLKP